MSLFEIVLILLVFGAIVISLAAIQYAENRSKPPLYMAESSEVEQDNNTDFNKNEGQPNAKSSDSIFPANLRSSYEIALAEVVSGEMDTHLWAEAYAHTDTDDAAKRRYVRERARVLDIDNIDTEKTAKPDNPTILTQSLASEKDLLGLGRYWAAIIIPISIGALLLAGQLATFRESGNYSSYLFNESQIWVILLCIGGCYIVSIKIFHKIITGHAFGKWPLDRRLRPRFFLGKWVAMSSGFLVLAIVEFSFDFSGGAYGTPRDHLGASVICVIYFLVQCALGLGISFLYKMKVRQR